VSPFLDRQHGTERCIVEQIERLAEHGWKIHLYSERVNQVKGLRSSRLATDCNSIVWHKVFGIPGPHLVSYLWWLLANHVLRWRDGLFRRVNAELTYSPGINCLDADVIVVHIVFHEFVSRVSAGSKSDEIPLKSLHLQIHRKLYYRIAMLLEDAVYRNPRIRIIAVSKHVAKHLKTHFGRADVTVIPNAVDTFRFTPTRRLSRRQESRQLFNYSDEDFVILLIGNDWRNKGVEALLRAFALLIDLPFCLLIVGDDDYSLYQSWLTKLNPRNRVRFERPSEDVLLFYGAADAYVGPSLEDAFGLPIIEAMACGLPVIASIYAGVSEFIVDGETGLLLTDPSDHLEIARLIRKLYEDVSAREKIALAASQYVQMNCSWDQNVSRTVEFLEAVLRAREDKH
jgi:glycosyltransferase involved in cell wall biosynthesis